MLQPQQRSPGTSPRSWEAVARDQEEHCSFRPAAAMGTSLFPSVVRRLTHEQPLGLTLFLPEFRWEELNCFSFGKCFLLGGNYY